MGRLLEARGLVEPVKHVPSLSLTTNVGYQSDLCQDDNPPPGFTRVYVVCLFDLSVVIPSKFFRKY